MVNDKNIYLTDVLAQMKTLDKNGKAVPFSIAVRTFQKYSKTGGAYKYYEKAKLVMVEENNNKDSITSLRTVPRQKTSFKKNPNHYANKTRNIKVLPQGDIKKINIRFIVEFNGKKVIY